MNDLAVIILTDPMDWTGVLKIRRIERHEIVVVQLPDDVLYRAQPDLLALVPVVTVDIGVLAEWDPRREVPAVGDDAEIEVTGQAIVVTRINFIDFDHESRGVVRRYVWD